MGCPLTRDGCTHLQIPSSPSHLGTTQGSMLRRRPAVPAPVLGLLRPHRGCTAPSRSALASGTCRILSAGLRGLQSTALRTFLQSLGMTWCEVKERVSVGSRTRLFARRVQTHCVRLFVSRLRGASVSAAMRAQIFCDDPPYILTVRSNLENSIHVRTSVVQMLQSAFIENSEKIVYGVQQEATRVGECCLSMKLHSPWLCSVNRAIKSAFPSAPPYSEDAYARASKSSNTPTERREYAGGRNGEGCAQARSAL